MYTLCYYNKHMEVNFRSVKKTAGFTIIEVLIVLVIAGLIILLVFFAIPALQRSARNTARKHDASLLVAAIEECLANQQNSEQICRQPANIDLPANEMSIFTGFFYGIDSFGNSVPPTDDQPNYMFNISCNSQGNWFTSYGTAGFVVTYRYEVGNGLWANHCLDG